MQRSAWAGRYDLAVGEWIHNTLRTQSLTDFNNRWYECQSLRTLSIVTSEVNKLKRAATFDKIEDKIDFI